GRISASVLARSKKSGSSHGITCRVGASRPPSRMAHLAAPARAGAPKMPEARKPPLSRPPSLGQASGGDRFAAQPIKRPLEAAGVRFFRLGERLKPIRDLVEPLLAGGPRH